MLTIESYVRTATVPAQPISSGSVVVYWMSRDQRVDDNLAFFYAQSLARKYRCELRVVFVLRKSIPRVMHPAHLAFMLRGLRSLEIQLQSLGIQFDVLLGDPIEVLPIYAKDVNSLALVADFNPLPLYVTWKERLRMSLAIPLYEVDAHNLIPVWEVSTRQEYGAYTLRPKLSRMITENLQFLLTELTIEATDLSRPLQPIAWKSIYSDLGIFDSYVFTMQPGLSAARQQLAFFLHNDVSRYPFLKNDPSARVQSHMSAYIHFGQIGVKEIFRTVYESLLLKDHSLTCPVLSRMPDSDRHSPEYVFLEEFIVRRELAENYCFYNKSPLSIEGFPEWARSSLAEHLGDVREYVYGYDDFASGNTHDALWNAAQLEMVKTGKMHGYMRMYWAKKILEWTGTPEDALLIAQRLNDRYELDGRDPNGYVGIAWAIGGLHDRPWSERTIFGKIRYMNRAGCERKFDVDGYIKMVKAREDLQGSF